MEKIHFKLMAIALALAIAVAMVLLSSYAWFVLSSSPSVEGVQVSIGGSNTIMIAPDMTEEADGTVYHYPGGFKDTLNINQVKTYAYLSDLAGLTPVSTADGINWFLPEFYEFNDPEVVSGKAMTGTLKDISQFTVDDRLKHANLTSEETELAEEGSYIFLDFWVVSPTEDCYLRVSTDPKEGSTQGSYVIAMPEFELDNGNIKMNDSENPMSAAIRVGFLANPDRIIDDTMRYYQNAASYSQQYTRLCGDYTEKEGYMVFSSNFRFTIYEPNADYHPENPDADGKYVLTYPVGYSHNVPEAQDIRSRLTVQKKNSWKRIPDGTDYEISQRFRVSVAGQELTEENFAEKQEYFYTRYLQYQLGNYVQKGAFITRTSLLYGNAQDGVVADLTKLESSGTTDDVYIVKLDKNVPQKIRMFVWLEGQDIDCTHSVTGYSAMVSIELAGSQVQE